MDKVKITASTLEDAITEASLKLGVTSDRLDYEVLEEGSSGFFGIGRKPTVIEACVKGKENKEEPLKEEKKEIKTEKKTEFKAEKKEEKSAEKTEKKIEKRAEKEEKKASFEPKRQKKTVPMTEENIKATEEYLLAILEKMGIEAQIQSKEDEEHALCIDVSGEDMGQIIGKRGQTLDALQYLLNRSAGRRQDGNIRIKLDTEDYRERRRKTLENLAKNIAAKAKKTHRNVVLEPMNPYERMIIHSTLQSDPAITTYSKGREPYRTVVVALKKD